MIVIDTSALMALLLGELDADAIAEVLGSEESLSISAGTLAEALIVAERRGFREELTQLLEGLSVHVDEVAAAGAVAVAQAYSTWGKGVHPAGLNFGDCFAYAAAKKTVARGCCSLVKISQRRMSCRHCEATSPTMIAHS